MTKDILIVDDEADIRELIQGILEDEGYITRRVANSVEFYESVGEKVPDLIILDIWLHNSPEDGIEILRNFKKKHEDKPVVMISGHGTIETAVESIKHGAYDFIEKPFKADRLILMIERALEAASLKRENKTLREKIEGQVELVGECANMVQVRQILERVAPTNSRVLVTGEPGTGKDIACKLLHKLSLRADGPFQTLNCAILHPDRLELELFGCESNENGEGAYEGVLEKSNGGTLLLDEVSDMPLETQGKIVRVLQEQEFMRVGGKERIKVDVRIIASTNRDLNLVMNEGGFRQDLYYRLSVVPVNMPPLRERVTDIPCLVNFFTNQYLSDSGLQPRPFTEAAIAYLQRYDWPGNVRQLRNVIEWIMIMITEPGKEVIDVEDLPPEIISVPKAVNEQVNWEKDLIGLPLREAREKFEKKYLNMQISRFGWNISKAAAFIGMERSALHRKLKSLNISANDASPDSEDTSALSGSGEAKQKSNRFSA